MVESDTTRPAQNITAIDTSAIVIVGADSTKGERKVIAAVSVEPTSGTDSTKTEQKNTAVAGFGVVVKDTLSPKAYKGMFIADKKPFANATVNLLTEKGKIYKTTKTDKNGRFSFVGVPQDKKFTVGLNEKEIKKFKKVKLLDSANEIFGAIDGYFEENSTIAPNDINAMIDYFFDN